MSTLLRVPSSTESSERMSAAAARLYALPQDVLCLILFEWLDTPSLVRVDSATTNRRARTRLLACFRHHYRVLSVARDLADPVEILRRVWVGRKGVSLSSIACYPDVQAAVVARLAGPALTTLSLFGCVNVTDDVVSCFCQGCPNLTSLDLSDCWRITDASVERVAGGLCALRTLRLSGCRRISGAGFCEGELHLSLSVLDISFCVGILDSSIIRLSHNCADSLLDLNMAHCVALSPTALRALLGRCPALTALNLDGVIDCDEDALMNLAASCPLLKELRVNECAVAVTDSSLKCLSNSCIGLQVLEFANCFRATDDAISSLCCRCRSLKQISTPGGMLGDDAIVSISVLALTLRRLNISGPCRSATAASYRILAERCTLLEHLNISRSRVSDDVVQILGKSCSHLCSLEMDSCFQLSPNSFSAVRFSALLFLNVSSCRLSDRSIHDMCVACPLLEQLHIRSISKLTDKSIVEVLNTYPSLRGLDMGWLPAVTEGGLAPLLTDMYGSLKYLGVVGCSQLLGSSTLQRLIQIYDHVVMYIDA